jgi:Na+/phosphate symporter
MAAYGWALMGAAWGVALKSRFVALGMRRTIVPALGYGLVVFLSCGLIAKTGDFGRLVAPGLFLLMQLPVLLMEKAKTEA